jgi:hypothetical protein
LATILETIRRIFPQGTNRGRKAEDVSKVPLWPPDVFALAATLVEQTGCYADVRYGGFGSQSVFRDDTLQKRVLQDGELWREWPNQQEDNVRHRLQACWDLLLNHGEELVTPKAQPDADTYAWWDAAMILLQTADEASVGMGFPPPQHILGPLIRQIQKMEQRELADPTEQERLNSLKNKRNTALLRRRFADLVFGDYGIALRNESEPTLILPQPLHSLCMMAATSEVVVQPKTTTAQTGMTLRSLTHNLALLPPLGEVSTRWILSPPIIRGEDIGVVVNDDQDADEPSPPEKILNLLLVPFPYQIHGSAFRAGGTTIDGTNVPDRIWNAKQPNFFDLDQHWLTGVNASALATFLADLIKNTEADVREVHGIVLPELALCQPLVDHLVPLLARETPIEFLICGTLDKTDAERPRNCVYTNLINDHRKHLPDGFLQSKHHRWQLERHQIRRYHLGHALSTQTRWWEKIDVSNRHCNFFVFRPGACMAALVCEDLARVDPVQRVLRAVGPNLVIALLLDGPQKLGRWSHRYATVLAEDPGSAVLTLTAIGMVERSVDPGQAKPREVALWKDARGAEAVELSLPPDAHALLLSIETNYEENKSLDRRSDHKATASLSLAGVRAITHPQPPAWARRG